VGSNHWGQIATSYSSGIVAGVGWVGGLVGLNDEGSITNCYSTAIVTGDRCGGLVGLMDGGSITSNYSTGSVSGSENVGGLVGGSHHWVNECFWDIQTSGQTTSAIGVGLTTADMQTANTYLEAGWDFVDETENGTEDIWWIDEGNDYPKLWWEAAEK
jgi:hypothetical protein